jgi:hypothetical protein
MFAERDRETRATRWDIEAAGFPCTVQLDDDEWVVTFASATVARDPDLVTAIMNAGAIRSSHPGSVAQAVEPSALNGGDEDRNLPDPPQPATSSTTRP